jgi:hypothetical protein
MENSEMESEIRETVPPVTDNESENENVIRVEAGETGGSGSGVDSADSVGPDLVVAAAAVAMIDTVSATTAAEVDTDTDTVEPGVSVAESAVEESEDSDVSSPSSSNLLADAPAEAALEAPVDTALEPVQEQAREPVSEPEPAVSPAALEPAPEPASAAVPASDMEALSAATHTPADDNKTVKATPEHLHKKRSVQFVDIVAPSQASADQISTPTPAGESDVGGSKESSPTKFGKSLTRVSSVQANQEASLLISRLQNDIKDLLVNGNESSEIFKGIFPVDEPIVEEFGDDLDGLLPTPASGDSNNGPKNGLKEHGKSSGNLSRTMTAGTLLLNENISLQEEARERNIMIEELRSKVDMLSTILTDSVEKTTLMEEELLNQSIQIGQLQETEIILKRENLILTKKLNEQAVEIEHSQGMRSKIAETEVVMNNLQEEMVNTLEKLLSTRQELKQLEDIDAIRLKEIAAYNGEIEDLKQELDRKRQELATAEDVNFETRQECERSIAFTERKMDDLQNATEIVRMENVRAKDNLLRVKGAQEKWELEKTELQKSIDAWKRMSLGTVSTPKSSSSTVSPLRRGNSVSSMSARSPRAMISESSESTAVTLTGLGSEPDYEDGAGYDAENGALVAVDNATYTAALQAGRNPFLQTNSPTLLLDSFQRTYLSIAEVIASGDEMKMKNELIALAHQLEMMRCSNARLLNKLQAARGNIQVCCRTRPPSSTELIQIASANNASKGSNSIYSSKKAVNRICVDVLDENELACYDGKSEQWRSFAFDRVWKLDATQAEVFADVEPLVMSVIDGYNCCLMAYGQTGSGKTFTMNGIGEDYGISYRTLSKIFEALELKRESALATARKIKIAAQKRLDSVSTTTDSAATTPNTPQTPKHPPASPRTFAKQQQQQRDQELAEEISVLMAEDDKIVAGLEVEPFSYKVEISIMEVYNDHIHDLLVNQPLDSSHNSPSLDVRQTPDGAVFVPGLIQVRLYSLEDVMAVFGRGSANRMTATTNLNERSSRSHLILQVTVTTQVVDELPVRAKLSLVDLAGSERVSKSGSVGSTMKEAQYINKSLSALGDVMEALDQKAKHIPYRNSKLTYLLNDSLGGNSRTMMIVTLCPTELTTEETLFSLLFATRVRNITIGAARKNVNAKNLEDALKSIKAELRDVRLRKSNLEEQVLALKRELKAKSEKVAIQIDSKVRTLDDTKKYADIQIQQYSRQNRELMIRLQEEKTERSQISLELSATKRDLSKVKEKLREFQSEKELLARDLKHKEREVAHLRHRQTSPARGFHDSTVSSTMLSSSSNDLSVCSRYSSPERESGTSPDSRRRSIRDSAVKMLEDVDGVQGLPSNSTTQGEEPSSVAEEPRKLKLTRTFSSNLPAPPSSSSPMTPSRQQQEVREEIALLSQNASLSVGNLIAHYNSKSDDAEGINLESYTHPTFMNRSPDSPRFQHNGLSLHTYHSDYAMSLSTGVNGSPEQGGRYYYSDTNSPTEVHVTPGKHQVIVVGTNGGATPASAHYRPKMTPRSKEALMKHQVTTIHVLL